MVQWSIVRLLPECINQNSIFLSNITSFAHFYNLTKRQVHSIKFTEFNNGAEPENHPTRKCLHIGIAIPNNIIIFANDKPFTYLTFSTPLPSSSGVLLFVNRSNLGFEDIEDVDPTTALELTAEDLRESENPILLKFVQYQRVKSITLFIEDNNGGDVSALGGLKFFGKPVATTNMKDFKKQGWGR